MALALAAASAEAGEVIPASSPAMSSSSPLLQVSQNSHCVDLVIRISLYVDAKICLQLQLKSPIVRRKIFKFKSCTQWMGLEFRMARRSLLFP